MTLPIGKLRGSVLASLFDKHDAGVVLHACAREGIDCAFIGRVLPSDAGVSLTVAGRGRALPQFPQDELTRLLATPPRADSAPPCP